MRAAVCPAYGPPEVVLVQDLPSPPLEPGKVRVRVGAAAVNFPDVLLVANEYQVSVPAPFIPGSEFAGVVEAIGSGVTGLGVGDRVSGTGLYGAFAEEVTVSVEATNRIPDGVDDRCAAAFGVAYRTAYHVLRSVAEVRHGDDLVVLGAGGGVGLAAVQIGVRLGATVTAVASTTEKLDVASSYGAKNVINHRSADLRAALRDILPGGADVVVDPVGGDLSEPALRALHWGGRFVTIGYASGVIPRIPLNLVLLKGIRVLGFQFSEFAQRAPEERRRNDTELFDLLAAGRIRPHIGASFQFDDVATALRHVAEGRAIGKVVLELGAT